MGFGGSTAWKMLEEGGKVVITDIQDDLGNAAAEQMRSEGYDAIYSHLDVVDEANWADVVARTIDEFGRIDILVNLAGAQDRGTLYQVDVEEWRRVMEISTTGILLGTRAVIPAMKEVGGGAIVNLSSMAGKFAGEYGSAYAMSRAGMLHFTRASAIQLAKFGIRANSVLPVGSTRRSRSTFTPRIQSASGGRRGYRWGVGANRKRLLTPYVFWPRMKRPTLRDRNCWLMGELRRDSRGTRCPSGDETTTIGGT